MVEKYKNIVVCGDVGTGTSTLGKGLARKLGWKYKTVGDVFRDYHKKHNIPLWNKMALPDKLDKKVDSEFLEIIRKESNYVIDGHYLGWLSREINSVFRILLVTDRKVATKRIIDRGHTHKETSGEIEKRRQELRAKFKKLYSDDNYEDPKLFHLVIDTTNTKIDKTLQTAYVAFSKAQ